MLTFEKFCKANKAHTALQADDLLKSSKVGDAFVFDAIGYKENCTVRTHVEAFYSHFPFVAHTPTHTHAHTLSAFVLDAIDWLRGTLHGTHSYGSALQHTATHCYTLQHSILFAHFPSPRTHTHAHVHVSARRGGDNNCLRLFLTNGCKKIETIERIETIEIIETIHRRDNTQ